MTEAEVILRLAMYYIKNALTSINVFKINELYF